MFQLLQPLGWLALGAVAVIDQISKVALSVYAMDVISITLTTMGFAFAKQWRIAEVCAKLACKLDWYYFRLIHGCASAVISSAVHLFTFL